jgi:hypothetical protein
LEYSKKNQFLSDLCLIRLAKWVSFLKFWMCDSFLWCTKRDRKREMFFLEGDWNAELERERERELNSQVLSFSFIIYCCSLYNSCFFLFNESIISILKLWFFLNLLSLNNISLILLTSKFLKRFYITIIF